MANEPPTTAPPETSLKTVRINPRIHARLSDRADYEGQSIQTLTETLLCFGLDKMESGSANLRPLEIEEVAR